MNEESDGINENENNNSEVVILPERSHVDELLLSDQSEIREDPSDYERKLDEKLKDLGLLEDDMTINQKEELLAVVVISCETAEQEENKRQLIKEYLEGAQNLQDEIEFSLQESAWLADEANLLCLSTGTSNDETSVKTKISSFMDCEPSTSNKDFEDFESLAQAEETSFKSSPVILDYATASSELFLQSSSASENDSKKQVVEKGQSDESRKLNQCISDAKVKVAITHPFLQSQITKKSKAEQLLDTQLSIQVENLFLDKTMSSWKPCMSPKDKLLSGFRSKNQKKENAASSSSAQDKVNKYLTSFGKFASFLKKKRSYSSKLIQLNKPYVVLHHGSLARKACKLDNYDFIIGVTDRVQPDETEENFMPCNTLTRAKSAFHRVKPSMHGRLVSFSAEITPSKTTRSGATYSSQKLLKEKMESSPEIILDDCFNQVDDISNDFVTKTTTTEKRVSFQDDVIKHDSSKKLPKFSDLRPEVNKSSSMIIPIMKKESSQSIKPNCSLHNNAKNIPVKEKLGNASEKDYSSDSSSSLIDVETIVDDEIEEFVMKRKLTSSTHKSNYAKSPCHSKKLKKNEP